MNNKLILNSEQTQLNENKLIDIPIRLALWPVWDSNYITHKNHNTNIQTMSQLNCMD